MGCIGYIGLRHICDSSVLQGNTFHTIAKMIY